MQLIYLQLHHFRNYSKAELSPDSPWVVFYGPNGVGKTNLLDAIYYLCLCKSYFNPVDAQHIRHGQDFFTVKGVFRSGEERMEVACKMARSQGKTFTKNQVPYDRLADHIGTLPAVMVAPGDLELVGGGSRERRRFMDAIIAQYDRAYLDALMTYRKVMRRRNAQLKQFAETGAYNADLLDTYDARLIPDGQQLHAGRKAFVEAFIPLFTRYYAEISGKAEDVDVRYLSSLEETSLEQQLRQSRDRDRRLQRTTTGPHKDELHFLIDGYPLKKFGSQGQQKSFVFALKLAQYRLLSDRTGARPLLLLDDVFDRLDTQRAGRLIGCLQQEKKLGQVFLTDTQKERLENLLREHAVEAMFVGVGEMR